MILIRLFSSKLEWIYVEATVQGNEQTNLIGIDTEVAASSKVGNLGSYCSVGSWAQLSEWMAKSSGSTF